MDNYNFDPHAELQSAFKMLGALLEATRVAGSWATSHRCQHLFSILSKFYLAQI